MGNVYRGAGEVVLKQGVSREQIITAVEAKASLWGFEMFSVEKGVLKYEYSTKYPDYKVFEVLKAFAAEPWVNYERSDYDDWRDPARQQVYDPRS